MEPTFQFDCLGLHVEKSGSRSLHIITVQGLCNDHHPAHLAHPRRRLDHAGYPPQFKYPRQVRSRRETQIRGGCATVRIKSTDERERLWQTLREATGEGHTSQALDTAARYYNRMHGDTAAVPEGVVEELLREARAEGSLTAEEIAEIVDTNELPVECSTEYTVGNND